MMYNTAMQTVSSVSFEGAYVNTPNRRKILLKTFGKILRAKRDIGQLTIRDVARKMRLSQGVYWRMENGMRVDLETFRSGVAWLGCDPRPLMSLPVPESAAAPAPPA